MLDAARSPLDGLRAHLHARLDELAAGRPDLSAALALQRSLLSQEIELLNTFMPGGLPNLSLPPRYVAAKLDRGIPALHGEPVPLPRGLLSFALRDFCERLRGGATEEAAAGLVRALDEGRLVPAPVLSACFGRDQMRIRLLAQHAGVSPDLLWLVAELALAPFAHLLQVQTLSASTSPGPGRQAQKLHDALARWDQGYCPACGSWPALIEAGDSHVLRCSFCACGWELHAYRCIYCGNAEESFLTAAANPDDPGRRLQLCGGCGGYAKVLRVDAPGVFPLIAVDDLASLDLDMAAIERQYARPTLPQIKKAGGASGAGEAGGE
jgi:FdhE protein